MERKFFFGERGGDQFLFWEMLPPQLPPARPRISIQILRIRPATHAAWFLFLSSLDNLLLVKTIITMLAALLLATASMAQNPRYQQYTGRYGGNSGICLFADGKFMLYGYATTVFGKYLFEKDYLLFYPDQPSLFTVYAHRNPTLRDSTRINFVHFQDGQTWVQFDKAAALRVFNEDANCFDAPFVYQHPQPIQTFSLMTAVEDRQGSKTTVWQYNNKDGCNDFVFIYNKPKQVYENFSAHMEGNAIKLSNTSEAFTKAPLDEEERKQWQEILQWKEQYFATQAEEQDIVFANKHYNSFLPDLKNYNYEQASALYIAKNAADNEAYFRGNQYKDDRYLRKYTKLLPLQQNGSYTGPYNTGSIFFTRCGDATGKSYKYNGFVKYEEEGKQELIP